MQFAGGGGAALWTSFDASCVQARVAMAWRGRSLCLRQGKNERNPYSLSGIFIPSSVAALSPHEGRWDEGRLEGDL